MKNCLLSLPQNTSLAEYEVIELVHPKGRRVSFLSRNDEFYELHHFEPKRGASSCFVNYDTETKVESLGMIKVVKYDIIFLLIPVLEKLETKGKVSISDLDIPPSLRQAMMTPAQQIKLENTFEVKKIGTELYLRLDREKLMNSLKDKCDLLLAKIEELKLLDGAGDTRKKSYCAHLIKDCLSKDNAKRLDDVLGINQEEQKENQPPTKKLKVGGDPKEDYFVSEDAAKPKAEIKLTKSQKDLAKAAKGTKSISSFFTKKAKK